MKDNNCITCKWAKWNNFDEYGFRDGVCTWKMTTPVAKVLEQSKTLTLIHVPEKNNMSKTAGWVRVRETHVAIDNRPVWEAE